MNVRSEHTVQLLEIETTVNYFSDCLPNRQSVLRNWCIRVRHVTILQFLNCLCNTIGPTDIVVFGRNVITELFEI